MAEQSWKSAISAVLAESRQPLHYREITERILTRGLKTTDGATPDATVNAQMSTSIKHDGAASPYIRVGKGTFALRQQTLQPQVAEPEPEGADEVIRAFGMYWQRDLVVWRRQPKLFGRQQVGAKGVDFAGQRGIYVLYDHHTAIYVGRAIDRPLGQRIFEHTLDRVSGRWNRFSWFGLYAVSDAGKLREDKITPTFATLVTALEAILIETLEPPQNRRRGDDFIAVEYIQDIDPELKEQELQRTIRNIEQKLRQTP
jgi:HB1, ASXL, restriction endonuclease HTH domain